MRSSLAWRALTINARRLLDFLEIEHMKHGGAENGSLVAPYNHLEAFGINRRFISSAIEEAERLGFLRVKRGARKGLTMNETSRYRLTYVKTREKAGEKWSVDVPSTDEWKAYQPPEDDPK